MQRESTSLTVHSSHNLLLTLSLSISVLSSPNDYAFGEFYLSQNITLCPGSNYEVTAEIGFTSAAPSYSNCMVIFCMAGSYIGEKFVVSEDLLLLWNELMGIQYDGESGGMQGAGPFPVSIPTAPAGGGIGWQSQDSCTSAVEFDSTGTFAYSQLSIIIFNEDLEGDCTGLAIDDVSVYQA